MEMVWRKMIWQMKPLEMYLPYSGRLCHYQQWKLSLASENETQEPLFLPTWYSGIYSCIFSSGDQ